MNTDVSVVALIEIFDSSGGAEEPPKLHYSALAKVQTECCPVISYLVVLVT
jgi:hypothetical protein